MKMTYWNYTPFTSVKSVARADCLSTFQNCRKCSHSFKDVLSKEFQFKAIQAAFICNTYKKLFLSRNAS